MALIDLFIQQIFECLLCAKHLCVKPGIKVKNKIKLVPHTVDRVVSSNAISIQYTEAMQQVVKNALCLFCSPVNLQQVGRGLSDRTIQ